MRGLILLAVLSSAAAYSQDEGVFKKYPEAVSFHYEIETIVTFPETVKQNHLREFDACWDEPGRPGYISCSAPAGESK